MNTISDHRREQIQLSTAPEASPVPQPGSSGSTSSTPPRSQASLHAALDRLPIATDYSGLFPATAHATLVSPALGSARDVAMQHRLDAFRDRFSGPYDVGGATVVAPPMFRMNTPTSFNAKKMEAHAPELTRLCQRAGIASAAAPARFGRCTAEQLVKVTQTLIDAGKLPSADDAHRSVADRIRGMQWEWGIGVDCAGYTQQAAAEAHGAAGAAFKANIMGDVFSGMMNDKRFATVDIANIRPGDVIHLDAPKRGDVGHNVICHAHTIMDDAARASLLASKTIGDEGKAFLRGAGPFHAFEVDSSWGAGDGSMVGGFRRDTWLFDASSFTWASFPSGQRDLPLQPHPMTGPQGELFGGAFRPREAR